MSPQILAMSKCKRSKAVIRHKRTEVVALEDDGWVWGVIFTTAALTGLCVVTLFSVAIN